MAKLTIGLGLVLVALGVGGYLGTGRASLTALIPAAFGILLVVIGLVALNPARRKHAMHAAVVLALLGVAGTARGLLKVPLLISDPGQLERPVAIAVQAAMAVLCAVFVVLGVVSFVKARSSRSQLE